VTVLYRKKGDKPWRQALPLFRLQKEETIQWSADYVAPNMFSGSIFDLAPVTEYDCRFVMSDPDGVRDEGSSFFTP